MLDSVHLQDLDEGLLCGHFGHISGPCWLVADNDIRPSLMISENHVGRGIGDHNCWCVRITRNDGRHDSGIDYAQAFAAVYTQPLIDHEQRVWAHLASARWVTNGQRDVACAVEQHSRQSGQRILADARAQQKVLRHPSGPINASFSMIRQVFVGPALPRSSLDR